VLAVGGTACSSGSSGSDNAAPRFGALVHVELPLPAGATRVGIASLTHTDAAWYAAGSYGDAAGQHHPGLWSSPDAIHWTWIDTDPRTFYGEIGELYSVAATDAGLVALSAATGGAHGNPRTLSWVMGADGVLHQVVNAFELYNGPRQISVRTITALPRGAGGAQGWMIIGSRVNQNGQVGATSWTSPTGDPFVIHDDDPVLSSSRTEQKFGFDATAVGAQEIAVGEHDTYGDDIETDGIAWASTDGVTWSRWEPAGLDVGGDGAQRMHRISAHGGRVLIAGTQSDGKPTKIQTWSTSDGTTWQRTTIAAFGVSDDVLSQPTATATTAHAFIVAARVGGVLRLATSADGEAWTEVPLVDGLPTGNRATLAVAADDHTLLVGATSLTGGGLWRSTSR
jgi:hypothetical protein